MSEQAEEKIVVANLKEGRSPIPAGAKCYVLHMPGGVESVLVSVTSRGGRKISIWLQCKLLTNPRVKFRPNHFREKFFGYHGRTPEQVVEILKA